ncbi:hypothetical protein BOX15_Mlig010860g1 [Macrostomum lignano]|uniref:DDE_3 domain-containing protein n=1 Tax=Macrostomum lignano TaxID=282301 RepID=A0A267E0A2_9PLAT|nr:hypothetical protein BOX15_Mlig010860g1 [Macrostomum lignano]
MLKEQLLPMLQRMPQFRASRLWFMQDGAPPHWASGMRDWLKNIFGKQCIDRGGPMRWPARSTDLTPCDFY